MTDLPSPAPDPTAAVTRAIGVATAVPEPDPSLATVRAINSAANHHQQLVDVQLQVLAERIQAVELTARARRDGLSDEIAQRLTDMDKANDLLASDLRKVPTDLQVAIKSVKELEAVKFLNIGDRFEQNERQTAREKAAADLALAAAFDAQKEAAAATNFANAESIRKSEAATAETIKTNAAAQVAGNNTLNDKIDDDRARMNRLEQLIITIQTQRTTGQESKGDNRVLITTVVGIVALFIAIVVAAITIYGILKS